MSWNDKLYNKEIFIQIFRKVGWIGIVYQIFLLLAVALPLFVQCTNYKEDPGSTRIYDSLFMVSPQIQTLILLALPIILGIFLYNFLTSEKATIFMHSLPISRRSIYIHHTLSGMVILIIPIFITMLLTWIIISTSTLPAEIKELYEYFDWILLNCSIVLVIFSISTFAAMFSGNFITQGISAIGIVFSPIIVSLGFERTTTILFYGSNFEPPFAVPLIRDAVNQYSAIFILISIIILILSYFIYLKRDIENSSESIVFIRLRPIFKYGMTIAGLLLTSILMSEFWTTTVQFVIGLFVGSFVGYLIAVLTLKEFRFSFRSFKGFAFFSGAFVLIIGGMVLYSSSYENKIPEASEISSITISSTIYPPLSDIPQELYEMTTLTSKESFEVMTEIHQKIINNNEENHYYSDYCNLVITYALENGEQLTRTYDMAFSENGDMIMQEILDIPELAENVCEFLDTAVRSNAESIEIYSHDGTIDFVVKNNEDAFNSFLDAFIADIETVGLSFVEHRPPEYIGAVDGHEEFLVTYIHFEEEDRVFINDIPQLRYLNITEEHINTVKWFEENGYEDVANYLKSSG